jgi:hypothetical protein
LPNAGPGSRAGNAQPRGIPPGSRAGKTAEPLPEAGQPGGLIALFFSSSSASL